MGSSGGASPQRPPHAGGCLSQSIELTTPTPSPSSIHRKASSPHTGTINSKEARHGGPTITIDASSCLGRTCLKWGVDGELTALDLALVRERLALVDQDGATLDQDSLDRKPCPSIS